MMQREDIHIISRYSNLTENQVANALQKEVYNQKPAWQHFLRLLLLSLGIGFSVSGIVFFFAYNWDQLHKFVKIGITEGLLVAAVGVILVPAFSNTTKNIILTGSAVLVGVLFAVFGQIYQTGANAYDFFLAWTVFVTVWVLVSRFAPLWLLYLVLINTTFILYAQQVAANWTFVVVCTILTVFHALVLSAAISIRRMQIPHWLLRCIALACSCYATAGIAGGIFDQYEPAFLLLVLITAGLFALGIWYGLRARSSFFLSIIPFSCIIIISAFFIKISDGEGMFLLVSLFVILSVTLTIKNLIDIQKKWAHEL